MAEEYAVTISYYQEPDQLHIRVSGYFDFSVRPVLQEVTRLSFQGTYLLDLAEVTYLDAAALTLIRQLSDRLVARDSHLLITNPSKDSQRLLHIAGLQPLLEPQT